MMLQVPGSILQVPGSILQVPGRIATLSTEYPITRGMRATKSKASIGLTDIRYTVPQ